MERRVTTCQEAVKKFSTLFWPQKNVFLAQKGLKIGFFAKKWLKIGFQAKINKIKKVVLKKGLKFVFLVQKRSKIFVFWAKKGLKIGFLANKGLKIGFQAKVNKIKKVVM